MKIDARVSDANLVMAAATYRATGKSAGLRAGGWAGLGRGGVVAV